MTDPYSTPKSALTHRIPDIIRPSLAWEVGWLAFGASLVLFASLRVSENVLERSVAETIQSLQFPVVLFLVALYLRVRSRRYLRWRMEHNRIAQSYDTLCAGACTVDLKDAVAGKIRRRRGLAFLTQDRLICDLQEVWNHAPAGKKEFRYLPVAAIEEMIAVRNALILSLPGYPEFKVRLHDPKRWLAEIQRVKANPVGPASESA